MAEFKFKSKNGEVQPDRLRACAVNRSVQGFAMTLGDCLPEGYAVSLLIERDQFTVQLFHGADEIEEFPIGQGRKLWDVMTDAAECARGIEAVKLAMAKGAL